MASPRTVAYTMSRFPKISETFILYEIVELERLGLRVEVFPLIREHEEVAHPEAAALVERAHYTSLRSWELLSAQLYWLLRRPAAYLAAWRDALWGNRESPKFLSRALAVVPQAARFARQMRELGVEHLHAHYATHPALAAYVVRALAGIPYSFTIHAHDLYVERPMLAEKLRDAAFAVAISDFNRRLVAELYGPEAAAKTEVIHCGVDLEVFRPRPRRPRAGPFTLICVASLQDYKGHPYLVDACARLRDAGLDFVCLCVGEGEDRPQIEARIAELGLGERVRLLGRQPRAEVSRLMAEADAMVLPSVVTASGKMEGIPVALMEALATELPAVATAISGVPELIRDGETGLLVPERDPAAIADAVLRLSASPDLGERLARNGRALVEREFDLRRNAAALRELLAHEQPRREPETATLTPAAGEGAGRI
jgi:glycosyltransferase involved in cell wall biosynthesis